MFGGVEKLQAFDDAPGFSGGNGLVASGRAVDVQSLSRSGYGVVQDHADDCGVGICHVYQATASGGRRSAMVRRSVMATWRQPAKGSQLKKMLRVPPRRYS